MQRTWNSRISRINKLRGICNSPKIFKWQNNLEYVKRRINSTKLELKNLVRVSYGITMLFQGTS